MTTPPLPGGPLATIREALHNSWHDTGCATNVGPEDGGGYCTPGCSVFDANAALDLLSELVRAAQESCVAGELVTAQFDALEPFGLRYAGNRWSVLPFETSTEEGT